jgi:hypothetical protein
MRSKSLCLGFAATVAIALACTDDGDAQPGKKGGFGRKGGFRPTIAAAQIVDRILTFDKNSDGKVAVAELPERMQHLVAMGDINKDGALDRDEITKLASTLEAFTSLTAGGFGPPSPFAKGGPKGGPKGLAKGPAARAQRAIDDMDLPRATRDKVDRALRASQEKQRRFDEVARAEIMLEMKSILKEKEYREFEAALDRPPGAPPFADGPSLAGIGIRIDRLQKDLDDFRRKLPE